MNEFTKAPWEADRGFTDMLGSSGHWTLDDNFMTVFCGEEAIDDFDPEKHDYVEVYGPNQEANARIIEAAPNMYAALNEALKELYRVSPSQVAPIVRAAIAKARGVEV